VTEQVIRRKEAFVKHSLKSLHFTFASLAKKASPDGHLDPHRSTAERALEAANPWRWLSHEWKALISAFALWATFVAIGVCFFTHYPGEDLTGLEAFYLSVITLTTVGFGDKVPKTSGGKVFATIWMLLGVAAFANMVGRFSAVFLSRGVRLDKLDEYALRRILEDPLFLTNHNLRKDEADISHHAVSRSDFILFMLKDLGVVDAELVEKLGKDFDKLDTDHNGVLNAADIPRVQVRSRQKGYDAPSSAPVPRLWTLLRAVRS